MTLLSILFRCTCLFYPFEFRVWKLTMLSRRPRQSCQIKKKRVRSNWRESCEHLMVCNFRQNNLATNVFSPPRKINKTHFFRKFPSKYWCQFFKSRNGSLLGLRFLLLKRGIQCHLLTPETQKLTFNLKTIIHHK